VNEWQLIVLMPDELKDGRQVLLWDFSGAIVAQWNGSGWDTGFASEIDGSPLMVDYPDRYAELLP
jgi:hypothetical protein